MLGPVSETLPDEIRGTVAETTMDYVAALRQAGAPPQMVQQYVMNGVEVARELHALGMKSGQLKKTIEQKNETAVQQVVQQRDQARIQQMQAEQQHASSQAAVAQTQQTLGRV